MTWKRKDLKETFQRALSPKLCPPDASPCHALQAPKPKAFLNSIIDYFL
jgi:hypothetical protein